MGAAIVGVMAWRAWQRRRGASSASTGEPERTDDAAQASGLAGAVGVARIDPEPHTQIAGEGIDPDADSGAPPRLDDVIGADVRAQATTLRR